MSESNLERDTYRAVGAGLDFDIQQKRRQFLQAWKLGLG